jgi:hypothetical protein
MTSSGSDVHVFIVRARRESREVPAAELEWRFWVEHHPGGEQRNCKDFASVLRFIRTYVGDLKVEFADVRELLLSSEEPSRQE